MSEEARKRRADEWKRFAEQEGGLFDFLDIMREEAVSALEESGSDDATTREGIWALLNAIKRLRGDVQSIIHRGAVDAAEIEAKQEIERGERKAFH